MFVLARCWYGRVIPVKVSNIAGCNVDVHSYVALLDM